MFATPTKIAKPLARYRCYLRPFNQPGASDLLLTETVQLHASNATEAVRLASLTTAKSVVDVERLDD